MNIRDTFFHIFRLALCLSYRIIVCRHESAQDRLYLSSDFFTLQNGVQTDSFDVLSNLVGILLRHNAFLILENLIVLLQEALNVSIKLMGLVEESLQDFHSQILANLENVSIFSNHFS